LKRGVVKSLSTKNILLFHITLLLLIQSYLQANHADRYIVLPLVSNVAGTTAFTDPFLVNPWGLVINSSGKLVVANNGSNLSTSYSQEGFPFGFIINVKSFPTGIVQNPSDDDFLLGKEPAKYIYATEQGTILAFRKGLNPINTVTVVNRTSLNNVYTGLTIAKHSGENFLYAADFHNRKIDVFNDEFTFVKSFNDPNIPAAFSPYNVQNIDNQLYVTYALQLPPVNVFSFPGPSTGFVVVFHTSGKVSKRLISYGVLNAPWGLALAPDNFGEFSGALLVGNFGDGHINAFNASSGKFLGQLKDLNGNPIVLNGLWSLKFYKNILYFSSGPNNETNGLVGAISPSL
jgi:uncharacterized protein (TIGR03118 family)